MTACITKLVIALGSDGPTNPYLNIMFASIDPDWPSEAITREQAVTAYTLTSAYAEFAEKDKRSLETGKLADLAVLSQDIFTVEASHLPKTELVLTMAAEKLCTTRKQSNTNRRTEWKSMSTGPRKKFSYPLPSHQLARLRNLQAIFRKPLSLNSKLEPARCGTQPAGA
jgi:hypothetical protein